MLGAIRFPIYCASSPPPKSLPQILLPLNLVLLTTPTASPPCLPPPPCPGLTHLPVASPPRPGTPLPHQLAASPHTTFLTQCIPVRSRPALLLLSSHEEMSSVRCPGLSTLASVAQLLLSHPFAGTYHSSFVRCYGRHSTRGNDGGGVALEYRLATGEPPPPKPSCRGPTHCPSSCSCRLATAVSYLSPLPFVASQLSRYQVNTLHSITPPNSLITSKANHDERSL